MDYDFGKVLSYAWGFYTSRIGQITAFSIPFILALSIPALVPAPTYMALGAVFIRTGSIPELDVLAIAFTAAAYFFSLFIISDSIVNVNLVLKSRKTWTSIKKSVLMGMKKYASRIFYVYTVFLLLMFIAQLLTYSMPFQSIIYPLFVMMLGFAIFFVPPAIVIDDSDTPNSIRRAFSLATTKPLYILLWMILGLIVMSVTELIALFLLPGILGTVFILLFNSLFILPFLIVLQTTMYMEKYPLAK